MAATQAKPAPAAAPSRPRRRCWRCPTIRRPNSATQLRLGRGAVAMVVATGRRLQVAACASASVHQARRPSRRDFRLRIVLPRRPGPICGLRPSSGPGVVFAGRSCGRRSLGERSQILWVVATARSRGLRLSSSRSSPPGSLPGRLYCGHVHVSMGCPKSRGASGRPHTACGGGGGGGSDHRLCVGRPAAAASSCSSSSRRHNAHHVWRLRWDEYAAAGLPRASGLQGLAGQDARARARLLQEVPQLVVWLIRGGDEGVPRGAQADARRVLPRVRGWHH